MLCSKSFASWTGTFDSLSCTVGPAVFSQWSLSFFVWEAFLWGWEPGDKYFWFWMHLISSANLRCCRFACQAVRGLRLPFWNAGASLLTVAAFPSLCSATCTCKHTFASRDALGALQLPDPLLPAMCIWRPFFLLGDISHRFRRHFSPLHMYPAYLGLAPAPGPSLMAVL